MKEKFQNLIDKTIFKKHQENPENDLPKQINAQVLSFTGDAEGGNYKLLYDDDALLLCKQRDDIQNYEVKIPELITKLDEVQDQYYYIDKNKMKDKYLKNVFSADIEDTLNNRDPKAVKQIHDQVVLKHPRQLVNGELKRFSFFSKTGWYFGCNRHNFEKSDFDTLGIGITTYFKTIKLFIVGFLLLTIINAILIITYIKYQPKSEEGFLFKATLGNTLISTYNGFSYKIDKSKDNTVNLNCENKVVGKFIYCLGEKDDTSYTQSNLNRTILPTNDSKIIYYYNSFQDVVNFFNEQGENCFMKSECSFTIKASDAKSFVDKLPGLLIKQTYYYLYYECIDPELFPNSNNNKTVNDTNISNLRKLTTADVENEKNSLRNNVLLVELITCVFLFVLYQFFKEGVKSDDINFQKDKLLINNYTLVLKNLSYTSGSIDSEFNDLVEHLNKLIDREFKLNPNTFEQDSDYLKKLGFSDYQNTYKGNLLNVFDIVISNVNDSRINTVNKIKGIKTSILNIKENNEAIGDKIKNAINDTYKLFKALGGDVNDESRNQNWTQEDFAITDEEKQKMENEKEKRLLKTQKSLDKEVKHIQGFRSGLYTISLFGGRKFVDIYVIFRNPNIAKYIYNLYNMTFYQRIFKNCLCCKFKKLRGMYYKNQWLNFSLPDNSPSNIKWENSFISSKTKYCKRLISAFLSIFIIVVAFLILYLLDNLDSEKYGFIMSYVFIGISQVVSILSISLITKLTNFERYSTLTKGMSSSILKTVALNFAVNGLSPTIAINGAYVYRNSYKFYSVVVASITKSMFLSVFTAHASTLVFYFYALIKRYADSRCNNGETTNTDSKTKYEELYVGPEFPIETRYCSILCNLCITLFFGAACPLIYLSFTLYLITTFIVDKLLLIYYYKNPPKYDNYVVKTVISFFYFGFIMHLYGTVYFLSNPYDFNYVQNDYISKEGILYKASYFFFNIFNIFWYVSFFISNAQLIFIEIININNLSYVFAIAIFFALVIIIMQFYTFNPFVKCLCKTCKKNTDTTAVLQNSPNIDIGLILPYDKLNQYYEVKQMEMFRSLILAKSSKIDSLIKNYKISIDYIKQNMNYKIGKDSEHLISTGKEEEKKIGDINEELLVDDDKKTIQKGNQIISGDVSYNLAFLPNYEVYAYFDLLYY